MALVDRGVRANRHGAEFEAGETPAKIPDAFLTEQNRPF